MLYNQVRSNTCWLVIVVNSPWTGSLTLVILERERTVENEGLRPVKLSRLENFILFVFLISFKKSKRAKLFFIHHHPDFPLTLFCDLSHAFKEIPVLHRSWEAPSSLSLSMKWWYPENCMIKEECEYSTDSQLWNTHILLRRRTLQALETQNVSTFSQKGTVFNCHSQG